MTEITTLEITAEMVMTETRVGAKVEKETITTAGKRIKNFLYKITIEIQWLFFFGIINAVWYRKSKAFLVLIAALNCMMLCLCFSKCSFLFSLIIYAYNHIVKILFGILVSLSLGCSHQINLTVKVSPKNFKVQTHFILSGRGIIINTYWGAEKKHHVLCLDNYSPSWIKSPLIKYDKSFTKYKDHNFNTSTADGTPIQGEIGICDSLMFENITFIKTPFYVLPYNSQDNVNDDGVFGSELMSKGIWKIDFKKDELTFASDMDSIREISDAEIFPSIFTEQSIKIEVTFGNNIVKTMAIDLGYNGELLLPLREFTKISSQKKIFATPSRFNTPASGKIINSLSFLDTVNVNHNWFSEMISSNETVNEELIGLQFFRRFDYVIFDFINKRIYTPKKVW